MRNSAQNVKPGDASLGLIPHFMGAFGRAGGTAEMLQCAADNPALMKKLVGLFQPTALATTIATFVTATYFIDRPRLWVSPFFFNRIASSYLEALVPRGLDGVESFDLTRLKNDSQILTYREMGGEQRVRQYAFTPDQVAALIDLQPNGEAGRLLTNGVPNLFHVVGESKILFVVSVSWGKGRWCVVPWYPGESGRWAADCRVFRNTRIFAV